MYFMERRFRAELLRQIVISIRADFVLYVVIALYSLVGLMLLVVTDRTELSAYGIYFRYRSFFFLVLMPVVALLVEALLVARRAKGRQALALRKAFSAARVAYFASGVCLLAALLAFQANFTSIKNLLPVLQGSFLYDRFQADVDAWLHFGVDPWRLLPLWMYHPFMLRVIEWNYNVLWFIVCFGLLFYVVTSPRTKAMKARYVINVMLVWIACGNLLAGLFLSAGPAFYGAVTGDMGRFADQLALLSTSASITAAANYQKYLWSLYEQGIPGFGSGISAFPSVHVGLISMNAFFAAELSRRLGCIAFCYASFVALSSVYLGWHYAIDGYASFAVVTLCYFASRRIMNRSKVPVGSLANVATDLKAA